jgi:hypothetical protein
MLNPFSIGLGISITIALGVTSHAIVDIGDPFLFVCLDHLVLVVAAKATICWWTGWMTSATNTVSTAVSHWERMVKVGGLPRGRVVTLRALPWIVIRRFHVVVATGTIGKPSVIKVGGLPCRRVVTL